jgi:hypothetical protein
MENGFSLMISAILYQCEVRSCHSLPAAWTFQILSDVITYPLQSSKQGKFKLRTNEATRENKISGNSQAKASRFEYSRVQLDEVRVERDFAVVGFVRGAWSSCGRHWFLFLRFRVHQNEGQFRD